MIPIIYNVRSLRVRKASTLASAFGISALHLDHDGAPLLVPWLTQVQLRR